MSDDPSQEAGIDEAALMAELERDEAVRLFPYDSATGHPIGPGSVVVGTVTVGIGRDLNTHGLTRPESLYLAANNVDEACARLNQIPWFKVLDPVRKRVLVEMSFNMGVDGVLKFQNMVIALRARNWKQASADMLDSKWAKQVGKRAERLARMMETGAV